MLYVKRHFLNMQIKAGSAFPGGSDGAVLMIKKKIVGQFENKSLCMEIP